MMTLAIPDEMEEGEPMRAPLMGGSREEDIPTENGQRGAVVRSLCESMVLCFHNRKTFPGYMLTAKYPSLF